MEPYPLKIDVFSHIMPEKYKETLQKLGPEVIEPRLLIPSLWDLDLRFRVMEKFEPLVQVLTLSIPIVDTITSKNPVSLAMQANEEMAELVLKHPDKFVAAIACLPMSDMDAALKEVDRAIKDLNLRGVQVYTSVNGKPLDSPEFQPLYEKMQSYNLPIYIHPERSDTRADYPTEKVSKYMIAGTFGWPYETTVAMTRLVFSGILEKYPNLKFITHHCGGMVPYFAERVNSSYDLLEMQFGSKVKQGLTKAPIEYYKMFYNDTALYGNAQGLMCGYAFFGADNILFGTDAPLGDTQLGYRHYRQTINAIEQMDISDSEKKNIFEDNARKLLRLPI